MLPKAHLTSHSRMSGSRWVLTPLWLSESLRSFLYSSSVYSCHLFLVSPVRSIPFLSFIVPIFAWNIPLVFLICLKRPLVFPILFLSSISLQWSLRKVFFSLLEILLNSEFRWVSFLSVLLFSQLFFSSNFITRHHLINHVREVHRGTEIQRRNDSFTQVIKKSAWWSCLSIGPAEKDKISPIIKCQGRLFRLREYGHGLMDMRMCSRIVQLFN